MNSHLKGSLLIITSMFLFSLQTIGPRLTSLSNLSYIAYSQLFFSITIITLLAIRKKLSLLKINKKPVLLYSSTLLFLLTIIFYFLALRNTTYANAMFTHYTSPIFGLIVAIFFLNEKFDWNSLGAIILSTLGMVLMFNNPEVAQGSNYIGMVYGVLSGLCYGILINMNKVLVKYETDYAIMFYQSIPIAILGIPLMLQKAPNVLDIQILSVLYIVVALFGALAYFKGIKEVKAQHIGIIAYSEIFFGILIGFLIFKEVPSILTWIGGVLIIASGVWIIKSEVNNGKKREKKTSLDSF